MNIIEKLTVAFVAGAILVANLAAYGAEPGEVGLFKLQYESGKAKVNPSFDKSQGGYLGSGTGELQGEFVGQVAWDLYEEQSNSTLHRTQFVGWITNKDGSKIAFETAGYFIPRQNFTPQADVTEVWDLTSAVFFPTRADRPIDNLRARSAFGTAMSKLKAPRRNSSTPTIFCCRMRSGNAREEHCLRWTRLTVACADARPFSPA